MRFLPLLALGSVTLLALPLAACRTSPDAVAEEPAAQPGTPVQTAGYARFGGSVDTAAAVGAATVTAAPAEYAGKTVTVAGEVKQVCQAAGCWATLQTATGTIRIKTPHKEGGGYEWTLPKDITGRRVVATGTLAQATLTADHAEHMARESGGAVADTATFEDAPELQLEATGVLVADATSAGARPAGSRP